MESLQLVSDFVQTLIFVDLKSQVRDSLYVRCLDLILELVVTPSNPPYDDNLNNTQFYYIHYIVLNGYVCYFMYVITILHELIADVERQFSGVMS